VRATLSDRTDGNGSGRADSHRAARAGMNHGVHVYEFTFLATTQKLETQPNLYHDAMVNRLVNSLLPSAFKIERELIAYIYTTAQPPGPCATVRQRETTVRSH